MKTRIFSIGLILILVNFISVNARETIKTCWVNDILEGENNFVFPKDGGNPYGTIVEELLTITNPLNLEVIFEQVNDFNAFQIQDDIQNKLPDQEPRVQLEGVSVRPIPDQHEYYITLQINVPSLNIYGLSLQSLLNNNGYFVL